jgi:predicted GIY-YIG superfamily endonuclease
MALSLSKGPLNKQLNIDLRNDMIAWFYILRLKSGALYIGATKDLEKKYAKHLAGAAGRTTSLDPPISLIYSEEHESFSTARQREAQVKRWSRAKKEALVTGDKEKLRALSKSRNK